MGASAAMLPSSAVQAAGVVAPGKPMLAVFGVLLGVIYAVGGILDHLELARVLGPIAEENDGPAV